MIIDSPIGSVKAPDFMVVGAARSGTTTLFRHLQMHPDIFIPRDCKEPAFFSFGGKKPYLSDEQLVNKLVWLPGKYFSLYEGSQPQQQLGDCSTSYLYQPEVVIENLKRWYGSAYSKIKIIIILRDPVKRAFSHHGHLIRHGHEKLPFDQAIDESNIAARKNVRWGFDYLQHGMYANQVLAFQENFPQVKVVLFHELKRSQPLMDEIFAFLDMSPIKIDKKVKANPSGTPTRKNLLHLLSRNPVLKFIARLLPKQLKARLLNKRDKMLNSVLKKNAISLSEDEKLRIYFRNDIRQLQSIIGKDLSSWM